MGVVAAGLATEEVDDDVAVATVGRFPPLTIDAADDPAAAAAAAAAAAEEEEEEEEEAEAAAVFPRFPPATILLALVGIELPEVNADPADAARDGVRFNAPEFEPPLVEDDKAEVEVGLDDVDEVEEETEEDVEVVAILDEARTGFPGLLFAFTVELGGGWRDLEDIDRGD